MRQLAVRGWDAWIARAPASRRRQPSAARSPRSSPRGGARVCSRASSRSSPPARCRCSRPRSTITCCPVRRRSPRRISIACSSASRSARSTTATAWSGSWRRSKTSRRGSTASACAAASLRVRGLAGPPQRGRPTWRREADGPVWLLVSLLDVTALRREHRNFNVLSSALQLLGAIDVDVTAPLAALLKRSGRRSADPGGAGARRAADAGGGRRADRRAGRRRPQRAVPRHRSARPAARRPTRSRRSARSPTGDDFFLVFPAIDALARIADPRVGAGARAAAGAAELAEPAAEALGEIGGAEAVAPARRAPRRHRPGARPSRAR